jgi:hypothetical protein
MTIRWIALLAFTFAVFPERLHALVEKSNQPESIEPWNQWTAKVSDTVLLKWKLLLFPEGIRVDKGEYKINQEVIINDKRYALISASRHISGKGWVEQDTYQNPLDSSCYLSETFFLLVDIATGVPLNRAYIGTKGSSQCSERSFYPYSLEKQAEFESNSSIVLTKQFQSEAAYQAHLQDIKTKQENAKKEQYKLKAANNDSKRKIGARICKQVGSIVYIGYTEKTSPDNGKIQVRISDARFGGEDGNSESDFKESIIWEDPTLWDLCE